jgi:hypothetical protein
VEDVARFLATTVEGDLASVNNVGTSRIVSIRGLA